MPVCADGPAARAEVLFQIGAWGEVQDSHDVDEQDIRVRLGSASLFTRLLAGGAYDVPRAVHRV